MRRLWIPVVVVLSVAFWSWPYSGLFAIARAAMTHNTAALMAQIDTNALKRSISRQIIAAYLVKSGRGDRMGAFQRGLANAVGTTIASPYLDRLLAPDTLASLLAEGRIGSIAVGDRTLTIDRELPSLSGVLHARFLALLLHSYYDGLTSFRVSVPAAAGRTGDYGVHLRLSGLTWRVSGLDLPPDVLDRIADDAIAAEHASG